MPSWDTLILAAFLLDALESDFQLELKRLREEEENAAYVNAADQNGVTTLMAATANNSHPEVITALIKAGADVNAKDQHGWTPLIFAAGFNSNPEVVTVLIKNGVDVTAKNQDGCSALDFARNNDALKNTSALRALKTVPKAVPKTKPYDIKIPDCKF